MDPQSREDRRDVAKHHTFFPGALGG